MDIDEPTSPSVSGISLPAARRMLQALRSPEQFAPSASLPEIDGYVVERELGRGGGGVTYLAHKQTSQAKAALKILHIELGEGADSRRAWRELDVLQQVRAPNLPRLLDFGTVGRNLFIATEFVDGTSLSRRFGSPVFVDSDDLRTRVTLLERLCRATHTLHERAVIHRDLKPSNVIVAGGDEPFIIDLGIALLVSPDPMQTLTSDGTPVGTPAFMAPEQARGDRSQISTRSDVYGLGAIGYWMLTGQTPHDLTGATLHEAVRRVGSDQPRDPRNIEPTLPKPLAAVLAKACALRPADRYGSALDLAVDLRRWLDGKPVEATPPGFPQRVVRWASHHPIVATTVFWATVGVAGLGAMALTSWRLNDRPSAIQIDQGDPLPSDPTRRRAPTQARLATPTGRTLHTWRSEPEGAVMHAELVRDTALGEPVVVTLIRRPLGETDAGTQLVVWRANQPDEKLWDASHEKASLRAPRESLPPLTSADLLNTEEKYDVTDVLIDDYFPERPGRELLVRFPHISYDPSAIRIYSLNGELLFEAWHWGSITGVKWLRETRSLVLIACNNEAHWPERGHPEVKYPWPLVVLSLHPLEGQRRGWLNPAMAHPGEAADWYQCLLPPGAHDVYTMRLETTAPGDHAPGRFQLMIDEAHPAEGKPPIGYYNLIVGLDGRVVKTVEPDARKKLGKRPDLPVPMLGDLPAILPQRADSAEKVEP